VAGHIGQAFRHHNALDDAAVCDHVTREGFALLDEMEAADSTHG